MPLGNGTNTQRTRPVVVIPSGSCATAISTGNAHTYPLVSADVQCWGGSFSGELGDSHTANSNCPLR
ncbi:MAG: hypothetical protein ACRDAM_06575 [Casimicrobium sp.]